MLKRYLSIVVAVLFFVVVSTAEAGGFQLTGVGDLNVTGAISSEWWYTTSNPTLTGTAAASASVTITIDGTVQTVTADSSGNWSSATAALGLGDHTVSLVSSGTTISFTLHITETIPSTVGAPVTSQLPVVGTTEVTLGLLAIGGLLIFGGTRLRYLLQFVNH